MGGAGTVSGRDMHRLIDLKVSGDVGNGWSFKSKEPLSVSSELSLYLFVGLVEFFSGCE